MKANARYRFVATLSIAGLVGGAWACGATAPVPEGQLPGDDEGDAEELPDGRVIPFPFDTGIRFDGGFPSDIGFPFDGDVPFDSDFPFETGFDSDFPFETGFDSDFPFEAGFDSDFPFDGEFDSGPPPDAGPPWDGGAPVTIAAGEQQPESLALDDVHVYWQNSGGTVLDCPLSGCPNNVPTLLAFNGEGENYYGLQAIAAGASTVFFITSSASIDSCGSGGCSLAPATYFADPGSDQFDGGFFFDGGGGSVNNVVNDSSNLYFTDSNSIYSCPIESTCPAAKNLITTDVGGIGVLAVSATEVFYIDESGNLNQRIRAVPIAGGATRVVCKSSNFLYGVNSLVVAGGYVYFTTSNDSSSIYQCLATGGGTPTIFAIDEAPYGLATDGASLYWTNNSSKGLIGTCPIGASCIGSRTIASGQKYPQAIAVNSTAVYWTTQTGIYSAAK
jgi:hypothetical protein